MLARTAWSKLVMEQTREIKEALDEFFDGRDDREVIVMELPERLSSGFLGASYVRKSEDGFLSVVVALNEGLDPNLQAAVLRKELRRVYSPTTTTEFDAILESLVGPEKAPPVLTITGVVIPEQKTHQGTLIKAVSVAWNAIVDQLNRDWTKAYDMPPSLWEEIVAAAYSMAGFDEVTLTPRSGDHGRDVIAVRKGVGCIKILGSVKAYKPGLLVDYDHIRGLLGVMSGERDASKGIITTTSDFPPNVAKDPFIAPFLPTRLELMNGKQLQQWLAELSKEAKRDS